MGVWRDYDNRARGAFSLVMMKGMHHPDNAKVALALHSAVGALTRLLPRMLMLTVALIAVIFVALALAIVLAAPSAEHVAESISLGTGEAAFALVLASAWALIPLTLMIFGMLLFTGMIVFFADAAVSHGTITTGQALVATLRRVGAAAMVSVVAVFVIFAAVVAAPLISLAALLVLAGGQRLRDRISPIHVLSTRAVGLMAIPFMFAIVLAIRWSLAIVEVFIAQGSWRAALAASWRRTRGRMRVTGHVLMIIIGGVLIGMWLLIMLGHASGSPALELALQFASSVVFAPLPAIGVLVLYRSFDGSSSPIIKLAGGRESMSARARFGRALPIVLSTAILLSGAAPAQSASAADAGSAGSVASDSAGESDGAEQTGDTEPIADSTTPTEQGPVSRSAPDSPDSNVSVMSSSLLTAKVDTTTTLDGASGAPWNWTYGDPANNITGSVSADSGAQTPTGSARLWADTASAVDPVVLGDDVALVAGQFTFDPLDVLPDTLSLWVEYVGDEAHAGSSSPEQSVNVDKRLLEGAVVQVFPTGPVIVGDTVTYRINVDTTGEVIPSQPITSDVVIYDTNDTAIPPNPIASGPVNTGIATLTFTMTMRSLVLRGGFIEDPRYILAIGPSAEWVLHAEPASTTTTLSVQSIVSLGGNARAVAEVQGPSGVQVAGSVQFSFTTASGGSRTPIATVTVNSSTGLATVDFCPGFGMSGSGPGVCANTPRAIVPTGTTAIQVIAEFVPDPADDSLRRFLPSESASKSVGIDASGGTVGTGECSIVQVTPEDRDYPTTATGIATPVVRTPTNCSSPYHTSMLGYRGGSVVTLQAQPAPGYELVEWNYEGTVIGTESTMVWAVPNNSDDWMAVKAIYQLACLSANVTVSGHASPPWIRGVVPGKPWISTTQCTQPNGSSGRYVGTRLSVRVNGEVNPSTNEADVFYRAGAGSSVVTATTHGTSFATGTARPLDVTLSFTVERDTTLAVAFGPQCRTVVTDRSYFPAVGPDAYGPHPEYPRTGFPELVTAPNCFDPHGSGFVRNSVVEVSADLVNPDLVVEGWRVNGELNTELGSDASARVRVLDSFSTTIEFDISECYTVDVTVAQGEHFSSALSPSTVRVSPPANCRDGSDRWAAGSTITLTPYSGSGIGSGVPRFGGWTDVVRDDEGNRVGDRVTPFWNGSGPSPWNVDSAAEVLGTVENNGSRVVVLDTSLSTTASFYSESLCSTIQVRGGLSLSDFEFEDTSCGPGRYYNPAKSDIHDRYQGPQLDTDGAALRNEDGSYPLVDVPMSAHYYGADTGRYPETLLRFTVPRSALGVQGTVTMSQSLPGGQEWRETKELNCTTNSCSTRVRGDLIFSIKECQTVNPIVHITVAGDESEQEYRPADFGLADFNWIVSDTPGCGGDLSWYPGDRAVLRTTAPTLGFEFLDWGEVDNAVALELFTGQEGSSDSHAPMAVHVVTDDAKPALDANIYYRVHCGEVRLGPSIAIASPAPTCPGFAPDETHYIIGSFIQVVAQAYNASGRGFVGFRGAIGGTRGTVEGAAKNFYGIPQNDFAQENPTTRDTAEGAAMSIFGSPVYIGPWLPNTRMKYDSAYVLVDASNKEVWGYYQHSNDFWDNMAEVLPNAGKFTVGVVSLAVTAAVPFCAPCAGAIALLQVSEFLLRLVPEPGGFIANLVAMANPLNFLTCATQWGFNTLEDTGVEVTDIQAARAGTSVAVGLGAAATKSVLVEGTKAMERFKTLTATAKAGGAAATFAYGLYENRIDKFDFSAANTADLRNTDAYTRCLANTYHNPADSN